MNLLDHVKKVPSSNIITKSKSKWTQYKEPFFILTRDKGQQPKEAVRTIAKFENLSSSDEIKLYNTQKQWRFKKQRGLPDSSKSNG